MKAILYVIAIVLAAAVGYWYGVHKTVTGPLSEPRILIVQDIVRDTVRDTVPVPRDSIVVRWKTVKVPVVDSVGKTTPDSARVALPVTQKEYGDSGYRAWVSGVDPSLDSIHVYRKTVTVTQTVRIPVPSQEKRWGLGVQVGAVVKDGKIAPYVGIGVSYNLLNF